MNHTVNHALDYAVAHSLQFLQNAGFAGNSCPQNQKRGGGASRGL
jgi:hypothetical protein